MILTTTFSIHKLYIGVILYKIINFVIKHFNTALGLHLMMGNTPKQVITATTQLFYLF